MVLLTITMSFHTKPRQFRSLHWNQVTLDPPHRNQVYFDHPHNNQDNFDAKTKSMQFSFCVILRVIHGYMFLWRRNTYHINTIQLVLSFTCPYCRKKPKLWPTWPVYCHRLYFTTYLVHGNYTTIVPGTYDTGGRTSLHSIPPVCK